MLINLKEMDHTIVYKGLTGLTMYNLFGNTEYLVQFTGIF